MSSGHCIHAGSVHHLVAVTSIRGRKVLLQPLSLGSNRQSDRIAASASVDSTTDNQETLGQPVAASFQLPSSKHQPQITSKERAALRAVSESLAKDKALQKVQVGAQGITYNVLLACMDVLMKHEFLRIKLGDGCGLERKATAGMLSEVLDCAVVGQIGFTITLYRKKGLPRPDNLQKRG
eukprot:gene9946-10101_t